MVEDFFKLGPSQRLEHIDPCARKQRRNYFERRVLRRRADKNNDAVFDRMQQRILLGFVETMDLVDKQDRSLPKLLLELLSFCNHVADFFDSRSNGVQRKKFRVRMVRNNARQGRLPYSRRAPKNN